MGRRAALFILFAATALAVMAALSRPGVPQDRALAPGPRGTGPIIVAVLGTSLTKRASWPDRFAGGLSECLGREVQVTRVARANANSRWGLAEAERVAASRPDLVLIEFALADADLTDGVWPGESRSNHRAIIEAIRERRPDVRIVLMTTNPVGGLHRLKRAFLGPYYRVYRDLADELGAGLLDAWPRWPGTASIPDGVHPAPEAEAQIVVSPLLTLVAPGFGAVCG
ncbi:SGNH/GDSL hydrolase family protein [Defluviimonas sp. SAOS-178_SWC]|uniref:SGNH/GDSL hydrolase family protein n=1 Tax=Defluviimonas sp. SAOS-178_SWC TaxID=3121287 RepID=UPI0032216C21